MAWFTWNPARVMLLISVTLMLAMNIWTFYRIWAQTADDMAATVFLGATLGVQLIVTVMLVLVLSKGTCDFL
jgi:hypothetical protein